MESANHNCSTCSWSLDVHTHKKHSCFPSFPSTKRYESHSSQRSRADVARTHRMASCFEQLFEYRILLKTGECIEGKAQHKREKLKNKTLSNVHGPEKWGMWWRWLGPVQCSKRKLHNELRKKLSPSHVETIDITSLACRSRLGVLHEIVSRRWLIWKNVHVDNLSKGKGHVYFRAMLLSQICQSSEWTAFREESARWSRHCFCTWVARQVHDAGIPCAMCWVLTQKETGPLFCLERCAVKCSDRVTVVLATPWVSPRKEDSRSFFTSRSKRRVAVNLASPCFGGPKACCHQ